MQLSLLILSLVGPLLSVIGWIVERVFTIKILRRHIAPSQDAALQFLENLQTAPTLGITRDDPSIAALIAVWPKFPHLLPVHAIGRTIAYIEFGPQVRNQIGLTLFDENQNRIEGYDWTIAAATDALMAPIERRFRRLGAGVFFFGHSHYGFRRCRWLYDINMAHEPLW